MPRPREAQVEIPLLRALREAGGEARPRDIYGRVAKAFPEMTPEEQEERLPNQPKMRAWWNVVQWTRQALVEKGEIDKSTPGIWRITDTGRRRLRRRR